MRKHMRNALSFVVIFSQLAPAFFYSNAAQAAPVRGDEQVPITSLPTPNGSANLSNRSAASGTRVPETAHRVDIDKPILLRQEASASALRRQSTPTFRLRERRSLRSIPSRSLKSSTLEDLIRKALGVADANAAVAGIPFVAYYDGIEQNHVDFAAYYLSQIQNADGSFSAGSQLDYLRSADVALLMSEFNLVDSDSYAALLAYLQTATTQTTAERAMQARVLFAMGQSVSVTMADILATQNSDGGFGVLPGYVSDPLTTAEVALALGATGEGTADDMAEALGFIISSIESDGAMRLTPGSDASYYLMNKILQSLAPFRALSVSDGANTVSVQSRIDLIVSFLHGRYSAATERLYGTDDVVDYAMTAYSFDRYDAHADASARLRQSVGQNQNADGSFGSSLGATVGAMRAIAVPDVEVSSIVAVGSLVTGVSPTFDISIRNSGHRPLSALTIHTFVDNFYTDGTYDLAALLPTAFPIEPQEEITIGFTNFYPGEQLVGDVDIKVLAESVEEIDDANNWQEATFAFSPSPTNRPALPVYTIAHASGLPGEASVVVGWGQKADPNRLAYILWYREVGTSQWFGVLVDNSWNAAVFVGQFTDGRDYEIGIGPYGADGSTPFPADISLVRVASDPALVGGALRGHLTFDTHPEPNALVSVFNTPASADDSGAFTIANVSNGTTAIWALYPQYDHIISTASVPVGGESADVRVFTRYAPDTVAPVMNALLTNLSRIHNQDEVVLTASATDNLASKEADFYFASPNEDVWNYIGTAAFPPEQSTAQLTWYVPSDLFGVGFRLRAITRDYQGNESLPFEYGPFEIVDGTPPEGSLTVGGLTNNAWQLGETHAISWEITAQNGLASFDNFQLHYGDIYNVLDTPPLQSQSSSNYTMPQSVAFLTDDAWFSLTVCDQNYNCAELESDHFVIAPPPSRFLSLTVDQPTITTNEQDIQTARLTIESYRPDDITDLRIRVNRGNSATQPTRGFFQWTPTTGFVEYYSNNNYGNNHVTLQLTGPNASERIVDTANHTVTYIFRWTISPTAGAISDSDISYYWLEPGNNKTVDWTLVNTNFVTEYVPSATGSTFQSLTVDKSLVYTDEVDVQTARLTIQTPHPDDITNLKIRVNRANTSQNPSRGLFEWTPTTGFTEYYSPTAYGNQHVNLQTTGPNASERIIDSTNHTVTFIFRWTISPSAGNVADSDISYYWQEPINNKTIDWTLVNTSFVTEYRLSSVTNSFLSLTVDKPAIVFDGTDLQTARLTLNTPNLGNITAVKLRINRAGSTTQPTRGFFTFTPSANLFAEYLPRNYGNPHVNLLPESEALTDTTNRTTTYIFRWTTNASYTAIPDNDLSFQIEETSGITIPWQLVNTNFSVGAAVGIPL